MPISTQLPGYRILSKIHGGGQGVVYLALQESTKQKVALKVIHEGPFADPRKRARFERGVRILAELNHPNIVSIIDSGECNGAMFYVMDYIEGDSLNSWLDTRRRTTNQDGSSFNRSRWPWSSHSGSSGAAWRHHQSDIDEIVRLFIKICDAVDSAHNRGIIHRDLKPGNIRIDDRNEPHLLDFDIARLFGDEYIDSYNDTAHCRTITGEFLGTLRWASPEQVERVPSKIDMRSDVYSLGVMMYEALTGVTPYPMLGTRRELEDHILNTDPPPPSRHRANLDSDVDAIVLRCLAKSCERRYHTAGMIASDLRALLVGEPISARRDSSWYLLRKLMRRRRVEITSLLCVLTTLLGCAAAMVHSYHSLKVARFQVEQSKSQSVTMKAVATQGTLFARYTLNDLYPELAQIPGTSNAREKLLANVNAYCDMLALQVNDGILADPTIVAKYVALGDAFLNLDIPQPHKLERALKSYHTGMTVAEKLLQMNGMQTELQHTYALAILGVARALCLQGESSESQIYAARALHIFEAEGQTVDRESLSAAIQSAKNLIAGDCS